LLDGILFEKLGTPAAVICTEPFIRSAENMSVAHGFKSYPFAVMPHPIGSTDIKTLNQWADDVYDEVASLLTAPQGSD